MTSDLIQRSFPVPLEYYVALEYRAKSIGKHMAVVLREAVDKFIVKYNTDQAVSQWIPRENPPAHLRSMYLTKSQCDTLEDMAGRRSISLGEKVTPGDAVRSAILEYLGRANYVKKSTNNP